MRFDIFMPTFYACFILCALGRMVLHYETLHHRFLLWNANTTHVDAAAGAISVLPVPSYQSCGPVLPAPLLAVRALQRRATLQTEIFACD